MAKLPEQHKQLAAQLLTTAATLERGYEAFRGSGNLLVFQPQVNEMDQRCRQWLSDLESFKNSLRALGAETKALEHVNEAFGHLAERIRKLARLKLESADGIFRGSGLQPQLAQARDSLIADLTKLAAQFDAQQQLLVDDRTRLGMAGTS
ncbi:hypothetical protein PQQ65_32570 [Paraburkholderia strydomiana]|uniref:hypothetical protein n=1 Tax=Paraburkholderia strydomiana TaxID=1245417 RepID=UPI0038B9ECEA